MPSLITTAEAFSRWENEIKPLVVEQYGEDDDPALSESWNEYTDSLCKDGELNDLQYHYCPAYDDSMPGDSWEEELSHLLENLGVVATVLRIAQRPDDLMSDMARHFEVNITRNGAHLFKTYFSQGSTYTENPDVADVMAALLRDTADCEYSSGDDESDFKDWCDNMGLDSDSRTAERIYRSCLDTAEKLRVMFPGKDLRENLREVANEI